MESIYLDQEKTIYQGESSLHNSTIDRYARPRGYGNPYAPILPGSGGGGSDGGSGRLGGDGRGGRGGGIVVISVYDGITMTDSCSHIDPNNLCDRTAAFDQYDISNVSLESSLGHWPTRISADGQSVLGGGGGGAGGSIWLRDMATTSKYVNM